MGTQLRGWEDDAFLLGFSRRVGCEREASFAPRAVSCAVQLLWDLSLLGPLYLAYTLSTRSCDLLGAQTTTSSARQTQGFETFSDNLSWKHRSL